MTFQRAEPLTPASERRLQGKLRDIARRAQQFHDFTPISFS